MEGIYQGIALVSLRNYEGKVKENLTELTCAVGLCKTFINEFHHSH